jgi:hypothetical protein
MILSLLRTPTSYFRPYRNYFAAIYGFFLAFPLREFVLFFAPEEALLRYSTQFLVGSAVSIAILWGHLTTRLYNHPRQFSLRGLLTDPGRPINFVFFLYLVPMAVTLVASLVVSDAILAGQDVVALYLLGGATSRAVGYGQSFIVVSSTIIFAFVFYPLTVLFYLRSQLKDREVRQALKTIAVCFGAISVLILAFNALATFGYSILGIVHLVSVILLIVVVRAFTRPTFLKAFFGVAPALEPIPTSTRQDQLILMYRNQDDKFGPISRFISESVNQRLRVVVFHREDESVLREGLSRKGFDLRHHLLKGNLRLFPLGTLYQGLADEEGAIEFCRELTTETRNIGKEGLRIVIDYGDQTRRPSQEFVEHLTDNRWTDSDHYVGVLMAFTADAFQGQEAAMAALRSRVQILDLTDPMDLFSRTMGLSHQEITGKKILLEYDPLSDYERVLNSLIVETRSNFERAVVFTRRESPLHSIIDNQSGLKTFVLTSRVSYPKVEKESRVLLPAYDSSLLLDAFNKTIEAYAGASFTIIFDSITHYVYTLGPERAHSLVRQALELMISDKVTAVFLINIKAHNQRTAMTFENLFDMELVCRQGARVPEVKRKLAVSVAQ